MENKVSQFELLVNSLSDQERKDLYNKLNNLLFVKDDMELDLQDDSEKDKFVKTYHLSLWDKILYFLNSIFGNKSKTEFILDKALKKHENKLLKLNPPWVDIMYKKCRYGFFQQVKALLDIQSSNREFITNFIEILNDSYKYETFVLEIVKFVIPKEEKLKLKFFDKDKLEDFLLENNNWKKMLNIMKKNYLKDVKTHYKDKIIGVYSAIFSLIKLLSFNFLDLYNKGKANKFIVDFDEIEFEATSLLKLIYSFPIENEYMGLGIEFLNNYHFRENRKFEEEELKELYDIIYLFIKNNLANTFYKVLTRNPIANLFVYRYDFQIIDSYIKFFEKNLSNRLHEVEIDIKNKKYDKVKEYLESINFQKYSLSNINDALNDFILKYSLPKLTNYEKFIIMISFYFNVWNPKIKGELFSLFSFKFYLFKPETITQIKRILEYSENLEKQVDVLESKFEGVKKNIIKSLQFEGAKKGDDKYDSLEITLKKLNDELHIIYRENVDIYKALHAKLSYNTSDDNINEIKELLETYLKAFDMIDW